MKHILTGVLVTASLMVVSCGNDTEEIKPIEKNGVVTLSVMPTVQSRLSTEGTTTKFSAGDLISVSSQGLIEDMAKATFTVGSDGTSLSTTNQFLYNGDNQATFYAYYPTSADGGTSTAAFTVAQDQNADNAHADNDFMTAKSTGNAAQTTVLTFQHQLAWMKVVVNGVEDKTVSVTINSVKPTANYDYATGAVTTGGDAVDITMGKHDSDFWALIPAQTFESNSVMLSISVDDDNYTFTPSKQISLDKSKVKKISLTIANGVVLEAGISAEQWTDDGTVEGNIFKQTN